MSSTLWYYVDRAQQRHGPVAAADVAAAYRAGDATDDSLVWREGLAEWVPLATHRAELGLAAPVPTPQVQAPLPPGPLPPPGAPPGTPAAKSGSGCLIVGLVLGLVFLVGLGILAAIALPAYRDYVERAEAVREATEALEDGVSGADAGSADDSDADDGPATDAGDDAPGVFVPDDATADVAVALAEARGHRSLVDEFVRNTDRCPRDASEIGLPAPTTPGVARLSVGEAPTRMCTLEIELGGTLAGSRIVLSRDSAGDWYCTSDMDAQDLLPDDCR